MKTSKLVANGLYIRELLRNVGSIKYTSPWDKLLKRLTQPAVDGSEVKSEQTAKLFTAAATNDQTISKDTSDSRTSINKPGGFDDSSASTDDDMHHQFIEWMKAEEKPSEESSDEKHKQASSTEINLPRLSRSSVASKCRQLITSLVQAKTPISQAVHLKDFCRHLIHYPEACGLSLKEGALPLIVGLANNSTDQKVHSYSRQALSLLGYAAPPKGRGLRILSIDGGGTKGIVVIEILRQFEKITGKPIHQLFDLICGVSTGAILAMLLGALQTNIDDCLKLYQKSSEQMFQRDVLRGTSRLIWTHAYYDTAVWEKILRNVYPEKMLIETAQKPDMPRIVAVSALINTPTIQPFVFRNYNHADKSYSYYEGSCKYKIWQAIRASAAAPGYFEEFLLDNYVHQDGGVLLNNPAPVAIHEAQLLWPNEEIQSCISIGSGKYSPMNLKMEEKAAITSLRTKISRFIDSATDTEGPHRLLQDLLKPGTYFRFNPTLSEWYSLDENRPEKLQQMQTDASMYLRKNEYKLKQAAKALLLKRSPTQLIRDRLKLNLKV